MLSSAFFHHRCVVQPELDLKAHLLCCDPSMISANLLLLKGFCAYLVINCVEIGLIIAPGMKVSFPSLFVKSTGNEGNALDARVGSGESVFEEDARSEGSQRAAINHSGGSVQHYVSFQTRSGPSPP